MNLLITLLNIAIFQGIILGVIILKSPLFKSEANKYLAYAIFSLSFSLLNQVLDDMGMYNTIPFFQIVDIIDPGLLIPFFVFLYIVHQVDHPIKHSKKRFWLCFPYFFSLVSDLLDDLNTSTLQETSPLFEGVLVIITLLNLLIVLVYIFYIYRYSYSFIKFAKSLQEKKWLTQVWFLTCFLFVSWLVAILSGLFLDDGTLPLQQGLTVFASFLILWSAYFGIYKFKLASDREAIKALIDKRKPQPTSPPIKETDSPVAPPTDSSIDLPKATSIKEDGFTKENPYFEKLEHLCKNDKIYRDSTIDRDKVAEYLGISTGYVSQLINTITGDNFATYINRYRVEAVKNLIVDDEFSNYSLVAIGLECGFSSKTTFHNAFKKIAGMTPNAYRKMHK